MKLLPKELVMEAIDTNILVRLATRDDEAQFQKVGKLMRENFSARNSAWISVIVVTEFSWVLARVYGYPREKIAASIQGLIDTETFFVEDEMLVKVAIDLFLNSSADYSDCLILARNKARSITPTHTFDRRAAKLDGFQLL